MMRMMLLAAVGVMIAAEAVAQPPSPAEQTALAKLAAENDAAWNVKDVGTVASHYTADGSLRLGGAAAQNGREAIRGYFTQAFGARQANLRHITKIENVDMVSPTVAFSDAYVRVERDNPDGTVTLMREFRNHSIAVKQNGEWRLRAVRAHPLPAKPGA